MTCYCPGVRESACPAVSEGLLSRRQRVCCPGVRGSAVPASEGLLSRRQRVCCPGVRGSAVPASEGLLSRRQRVCCTGVRGPAVPASEGLLSWRQRVCCPGVRRSAVPAPGGLLSPAQSCEDKHDIDAAAACCDAAQCVLLRLPAPQIGRCRVTPLSSRLRHLPPRQITPQRSVCRGCATMVAVVTAASAPH